MPLEIGKEETSRIFAILERVLFLKGMDIFANVDTERLSVVAEIAREVVVSPGEIVAREGDIGESLYIVKEGSLRILKEKDGTPYTLKNLRAGECFGVYGIFADKPRSAGAIANERTLLFEIRRNEFKKVLISNPEIAYNIVENLSERLNEMDNEIVLLNKTLNARLSGGRTAP
jgi:CRP-like cAMP-binding protein